MKLFAPRLLYGQHLQECVDQIIEIDGKIITKIRPGTPSEADVVVGAGETVLPGMVDGHSHLALDARIPGHLLMMDDSEAAQTIRALKVIKDNLASGITGLRSVGDRYHLDVLLRNMVEEGTLEGPWMQVAGIGMKGLHGHGYVGKSFSGTEELRRQARENLYVKTDWLKIFITAGAPPQGSHIPWFLSREEVRVVVEEARMADIKTSAHCIGGEGLRYCVEEGIDVLDHCYWADEQDIDLIMRHGTTVCFTPGVFMDDTRLPMCPSTHVSSVMRTRDEVQNRLAALIAAKPKFIIGSDAYHTFLYKDIEYMVELGMTRIEAIKGVTVYPGLLMNRKVGALAQGHQADIIAVQGDPLTEAEVLSKPTFVMRGGAPITG